MLFMLLVVGAGAVGQSLPCSEIIKEASHSKRKSREAMTLLAGHGLTAEASFFNAGRRHTLKMSITFRDSLGYPEEAGDLLRINFENGSFQEIVSSEKKTYQGTVVFTLFESKRRRRVMTYEDRLFYEKLRQTNVTALQLMAGNISRKISLSTEQADYIKKVVDCVVESN